MKKRFIIELAYQGKNYHGWQSQPNALTVQESVENALSTLLRTEISVTGAGRTDTGVHASYYVAHFDGPADIQADYLCYKLNSYLDSSVSVFSIKETSDDFHARFKAISRTYKYHIHTKKSAFLSDLSYAYTQKLDVGLMQKASDYLLEIKDFSSFAKLHSNNKTNICNLSQCQWEAHPGYLIFTIKADRFLRNMVRAITGTLLDAGRGKISLDEFREIVNSKDNQKAGKSAPSVGLYLFDIEYPEKYNIKNNPDFGLFPFL